MTTTMRIGAVLLFLGLVPVPARAQESTFRELAQELFTVETAYPQDAGALQLTADARIGGGATARLQAEYGISDRLQGSVATPYLALEEGQEMEWAAGVLYSLLNRPSLAAAVSLEAVYTTDPGDAELSWEPALIVARQVGAAQLHGSVAASLGGESTELAPGLGLMLDAGRLTPTLELAAAMADGEPPEISLTPGVFVRVSPRLEAGLAAPVDLRGSAQPAVLALVTLEF